MTTGLLHEEERVAGRPSGQQAQSRSLSTWQDAAAWPPILVRGPKSGWKTPVSLAPAPGTDGWILCICSWAWLASGAGIYMDCLYTACWPPKNEHVRRVKNMRRPFYALHVRSGPHWPNWFWDRRKVSMPQWIKDKRVRSSHTDIKKIRTFNSGKGLILFMISIRDESLYSPAKCDWCLMLTLVLKTCDGTKAQEKNMTKLARDLSFLLLNSVRYGILT